MKHCCPKEWMKFFKSVCDEHRQAILDLLHKNKEMNATEIIDKMKLSQPTVSHHLKILKDAGLVNAHKKGKEVFYSLIEGHIHQCCSGFMKHFSNKKKK